MVKKKSSASSKVKTRAKKAKRTKSPPKPNKRLKNVEPNLYKVDLNQDQQTYTQYSRGSARVVYWLALLAMGVFNFLIFLALIPFMLVLNPSQLLLVVGAIGLLFGAIFSFLIVSLEHTQPRHHLFAALFIPLLALIDIFILVNIGLFLRGVSQNRGHLFVQSSIVYVIMFALPYLARLVYETILKHSAKA